MMLEVRRQVRINCPVEVVRSQFADVALHEAVAPHRGVEFRVRSDDSVRCEYEQRTRVGPVVTRQVLVLVREDPARQVNHIVEGMFVGGSITFEIDDTDETDETGRAGEASRVTATLRADLRGAARLAAPALRWTAGRSLARALEEDRVLLEAHADAR